MAVNRVFSSFVLLFFLISPAKAEDQEPTFNDKILANIFTVGEFFHFEISWSGGIKIGDLTLDVHPDSSGDGYAIRARVTDHGLFKFFYPVDDTFVTMVRGPLKLPYRYEVLQKEGWGREKKRLTLYDQEQGRVQYWKNDHPEEVFDLEGTVYNEFSSFFATRALALSHLETQPVVIPTFADKKRHPVKVHFLGREERSSIFGDRDTLKIMPKMNFRGLYDKDGDTVFWLTDDDCRIPLEINSKILIGSLRATLVEYRNERCPQ